RLAATRELRDRVSVHSGYVPAERIAPLLADHDLLSLTYRSATASQNVLLAHRHGLAVLRRLADPDEVERIRAGVTAPDLRAPWTRYVGALEVLGGDAVRADPTIIPTPPRRSRLGRVADRVEGLVIR